MRERSTPRRAPHPPARHPAPARPPQRRDTTHARGRIAHEPAADLGRNNVGGEDDSALTAVFVRSCFPNPRGLRVTPAGAETGAPALGVGLDATVLNRATTRSVIS